jgi:iron complex transport system permease protein
MLLSWPFGRVLLLLTVSLVVVSGVAVSQGAYPLHWSGRGLSAGDAMILLEIRLPRLLMALLTGAALAVCGAVMQALFRNPLADPGLLGLSSGASLAVGLWIVCGPVLSFIPAWGQAYVLSGVAFAGALASCWLIFRLARRSFRVSVLHLLLAGLAINALAGSVIGFLNYISDDQQLRALSFWAMGNLGGTRWLHVLVMASGLIPALIYLLRQSSRLNLLLLGEQEAGYLGIPVEAFKRRLVAVTALCIGLSVAFTGLIGFVGLIVPHLMRLLAGADHRRVLPGSCLLGAMLLALADTVGRLVVIPAELPVGLVTSLIGSLFFLWLLLQSFHE